MSLSANIPTAAEIDPMNVPGGPDYDEFSRANCIKKGALFGFAIGMLVGMFWVGIAPPEGGELTSLARFRDVILAGIGVGTVIGIFWPKPPGNESSAKNDEQDAERFEEQSTKNN